jgi:hypothetical protein
VTVLLVLGSTGSLPVEGPFETRRGFTVTRRYESLFAQATSSSHDSEKRAQELERAVSCNFNLKFGRAASDMKLKTVRLPT